MLSLWKKKQITLGGILTLLTTSLVVPSLARAEYVPITDDFSFAQPNKQLHIAASYGLALSGTVMLRSQKIPLFESALVSSIFTMGLLTAKELFLDDHYSRGDQIANLIGVGSNLFIVATFHF